MAPVWSIKTVLKKNNMFIKGQIIGGDIAKFCGLLRIYEL